MRDRIVKLGSIEDFQKTIDDLRDCQYELEHWTWCGEQAQIIAVFLGDNKSGRNRRVKGVAQFDS